MIPNKCTIKDYKALLREADEEIEAREKHIRYLENKNQKLLEQIAKRETDIKHYCIQNEQYAIALKNAACYLRKHFPTIAEKIDEVLR